MAFVRKKLFADDFYEDTVGELAVYGVDYAVFYEAFQDEAGLG